MALSWCSVRRALEGCEWRKDTVESLVGDDLAVAELSRGMVQL